MNTIYLIRHGRTEANEKHLYCGSTDLPLSAAGLAELKELKKRYPDLTGCRFVTSGMLRTKQTLEVLFGAVLHDVDPGLREMDFGVFEMHGYEELQTRDDYQAWITGDNEANTAPNGESGIGMQRRVLEAFEKQTQSGQDTVIITHGGPIASLMEALFPNEGKNRYQWQPKPGRGYAIAGENYWSLP